MEFGRPSFLTPPTPIPLPEADPRSRFTTSTNEFYLYVGAPVWGCAEWVGSLYPPQTTAKDYLKHYAKQFNCIELNSTFYGLPEIATLKRWKESVPKNFRFAPKIPQTVSHVKDLRNAISSLHEACTKLLTLEENLGRSFLQLPPHFSPAESLYLKEILDAFPKDFQLAIEFRHPDWFQDHKLSQRTFDFLAKRKITPVITDTLGRRDVVHMSLTSPCAMVRFLGNADDTSDFQRLEEWLLRLQEWKQNGVHEVYFFIHQPDNIATPQTVQKWIPQLREKLSENVLNVHFHEQTSEQQSQMNLF